ncbi:hypothetical protein [Halalkalicoccus tibetensis]|uniref:Uncharacterized protein n=1 Tax=Halalkalicoccus tibetensis TaxID=175632 RepID=A0ABD5VCN5_9EURY
MFTLKSIFSGVLQHVPTGGGRPERYSAPISPEELTGEYLLLEVTEELSPEAEAAVTALLTETHRNGFTAELTDTEGDPSLFPPGASLFGTAESDGRLQGVLSVLERFTHVFRSRGTDTIVINAARIEENVRIAEQDPGKSGTIAQRNVDALAECLTALTDEHYRFVDGDAVPSATRDSHLIQFRESLLYR